MKTKQYTDIDTIKLWEDADKMTTKELVEYLGEILDEYFSDVQIECAFERLKERVGLKSKMPNTNTKETLLEYGMPEKDMIEVAN